MARYAPPREPGGVASNISRENADEIFVVVVAGELFVMTFPERMPTVMTTSKTAASANLTEYGTIHGAFFFSSSAVRAMTLVANP
jgi:hypothetical protein